MKKIITKPHIFFFILIPVVIILGFIYKEEVIDLSIYNTYFVMEYHNLSYLFAVFFGLIGLNYFSLHWAKKTPKKWLTGIHIVLQTIALVLFFTMNKWNMIKESELPNGEQYVVDYSYLILIISFFIFIIATFIHLISFFSTLISKTKEQ